MEAIKIENLTFTYPKSEKQSLCGISLEINHGEFITICGKSGCGKSTLLKSLKPDIAPWGEKTGSIYYKGEEINSVSKEVISAEIGFVMQDPNRGIVCDKVWHEMAFGPENLGMKKEKIRLRVAETAAFFGIEEWFYKDVKELSGGQKQILNLASVMVMQPSVIILDEPTSQLDPIAAHNFMNALSRINKELGITVILSEHRLEEVFSISDRIVVMEEGKIIADEAPNKVGQSLFSQKNTMLTAMPSPVRIFYSVKNKEKCPINIKEGREWLSNISHDENYRFPEKENNSGEEVLKVSKLWFRYEKNSKDVIKDLTFGVRSGEIYAIVGGNGAGKSTAISLITGSLKAYRGNIRVSPECKISALPQNPQDLFVENTVRKDLESVLSRDDSEKDKIVEEISRTFELERYLDTHPYDLSGGEQQKAAIAKVLLTNPQILILDEPTKGLDAVFKRKLAGILRSLSQEGKSIIIISHDLEFCAEYADRCAMFFDGKIISSDCSKDFFSGNNFYTTPANRMSANIIKAAVTDEDILEAINAEKNENSEMQEEKKLESIIPKEKKDKISNTKNNFIKKKRMGKSGIIALIITVIAEILTIYAGINIFDDRKYYFISLLMIAESFVPFLFLFERKKPSARLTVMISVLCAIGVCGRAAFAMIPQFKPMAALIVITGACLGCESGFLVGMITAFVSNFIFGQGPWTPWQMFGFGMIGFVSGIFLDGGSKEKKKIKFCIFGFLATVIIYGGVVNPSTVLMQQAQPTTEMIMSSYVMGLPFDLIHGASTVFFLWIAAEPMCEKINRIKVKYNIM